MTGTTQKDYFTHWLGIGSPSAKYLVVGLEEADPTGRSSLADRADFWRKTGYQQLIENRVRESYLIRRGHCLKDIYGDNPGIDCEESGGYLKRILNFIAALEMQNPTLTGATGKTIRCQMMKERFGRVRNVLLNGAIHAPSQRGDLIAAIDLLPYPVVSSDESVWNSMYADKDFQGKSFESKTSYISYCNCQRLPILLSFINSQLSRTEPPMIIICGLSGIMADFQKKLHFQMKLGTPKPCNRSTTGLQMPNYFISSGTNSLGSKYCIVQFAQARGGFKGKGSDQAYIKHLINDVKRACCISINQPNTSKS